MGERNGGHAPPLRQVVVSKEGMCSFEYVALVFGVGRTVLVILVSQLPRAVNLLLSALEVSQWSAMVWSFLPIPVV